MIIFHILDSSVKTFKVGFMLDDFYSMYYKELSVREVNELEKIRYNPERLERSFLDEKFKYVMLPFIEQNISKF